MTMMNSYLTGIITVMIMMITPLVVAVLYYWMISFLWVNVICCTWKHFSIFIVPQKRLFENETLSLPLGPPDVTHFYYGHYCHRRLSDRRFPKRGSITWTWYSCGLTLPLVMTSSVPRLCTDYAHYRYAPCWFISAFYHLNQWLFPLPTGRSL